MDYNPWQTVGLIVFSTLFGAAYLIFWRPRLERMRARNTKGRCGRCEAPKASGSKMINFGGVTTMSGPIAAELWVEMCRSCALKTLIVRYTLYLLMLSLLIWGLALVFIEVYSR